MMLVIPYQRALVMVSMLSFFAIFSMGAQSIHEKLPPLHHAVLFGGGDINEVKKLLQGGADINELYSHREETPLYGALTNSEINEKIVELLIKKGADLNKGSNLNWFTVPPKPVYDTPLIALTQRNFLEKDGHTVNKIIKLLVNNGARINYDAENYDAGIFNIRSPLGNCLVRGNAEGALFLIKKGAHVNVRDNNGLTPLHMLFLAIDRSKFPEQGFRLREIAPGISQYERPSYDADTAKKLVQALLDAGADINARDAAGNTPLFYAKRDYPLVVPFLKGLGAQ